MGLRLRAVRAALCERSAPPIGVPGQIEAARQEVARKLDPATVEFLKRRAAAKAAEAAAAAARPSHSSGAESSFAERPAPPPMAPVAVSPGDAAEQGLDPEQLQAPPDARLVARLRFSTDGHAVGVRPTSESGDSYEAVVLRDPLRYVRVSSAFRV
jgi:RPAP1-like, N-terminal